MGKIDEAAIEAIVRVFVACNGAYLFGLSWYMIRATRESRIFLPILLITLSYMVMTLGAIIALYVGALSPLRMIIAMTAFTLGDVGLTLLAARKLD